MTLSPKPFKHLNHRKDKLSAKEYNQLVDLTSKMARSDIANSFADSSGFSKRDSGTGSAMRPKLFEVQSEATGDGIYNCYEQIIDATDWTAQSSQDKLYTLSSINVEVFNLLENFPESVYTAGLNEHDKLIAWQKTDDEGNTRWIGIPVGWGDVRQARTQEASPAATYIACKIFNNNGVLDSTVVSVYCNVIGGGTLADATPPLASGDDIHVTNIQGKWWNIETTYHNVASSSSLSVKLFEVTAVDTGDGVYICDEVKVDSSEWTDAGTGDDHLATTGLIDKSVLNLMENNLIASGYKEALGVGCRMFAVKTKDDDDNNRWVGMPITGNVVRRAKTTQAAPADTKITANLIGQNDAEITSGLGSGIDVYCDITSGNLDDAIPRLTNDMEIPVYNINGKWWCAWPFYPMDICV